MLTVSSGNESRIIRKRVIQRTTNESGPVEGKRGIQTTVSDSTAFFFSPRVLTAAREELFPPEPEPEPEPNGGGGGGGGSLPIGAMVSAWDTAGLTAFIGEINQTTVENYAARFLMATNYQGWADVLSESDFWVDPAVSYETDGSDTLIAISMSANNWVPEDNGTINLRGWNFSVLDAASFRGIRSWGTFGFPFLRWRDFDATAYSDDIVVWPEGTTASSIRHNARSWGMFSYMTMSARYPGCIQEFIEGVNMECQNTTFIGGQEVRAIPYMGGILAFSTSTEGASEVLDLSGWNVSMAFTFSGLFKDTNFGVTGLNTWTIGSDPLERGARLSLGGLFDGATGVTVPGCGSWDVSGVLELSYMFRGATNFVEDLSSWRPGKCTSFAGMFEGALLFNSDISEWDTGSATRFDDMFRNADSFNQDISGWDVRKVTDTSSMFGYANGFRQDLSRWADGPLAMENLTNAGVMFFAATAQVAAPELPMKALWESTYPEANFHRWWE
jgi:surface protein